MPLHRLYTIFLLTLLSAAFGINGALRAEARKIIDGGGNVITADLSDSWRDMTIDEIKAIARQSSGTLAPDITFSAGYTLRAAGGTGEETRAYLLVLINRGEQVPAEKIQKMYSWLHGNEKIMTGILPADVSGMAIEDIEFLPSRPAIIFQAVQKVNGQEFASYSGILFMKTGYVNVIGYSTRHLFPRMMPAFDAFFRSLLLPAAQQYPLELLTGDSRFWKERILSLFAEHWQRVLGLAIILAVYGYVLLWKENRAA